MRKARLLASYHSCDEMCDGNADFDTRAHTARAAELMGLQAYVAHLTYRLQHGMCVGALQGMARRKWVQGQNPLAGRTAATAQHI
ncbi:hypothetical protein IG631_17849 [Alternaria alternata]|nr:hypothetical protein IG631_17849 [Alternaria alternata]